MTEEFFMGPWDAVRVVDAAILCAQERHWLLPSTRESMLRRARECRHGPRAKMIEALSEALDAHKSVWVRDDPCDEVKYDRA